MANEPVITVIGNLTADPELRTLGSGVSVANFTVAQTPRTYNRNTNQWDDGNALFMRCNAWRDLADHCAQSLTKGMRVVVQGKLQQRSYQANDGTNRIVYELNVDDIGPSLRYATAQVQRIQRNQQQANGYRGNYPNGSNAPAQYQNQNGSYQGGATQQQNGFGNQQQNTNQGGGNVEPSASQNQSDPWGQPGMMAGSDEFSTPGDEPEF